MAPPIDEKPPMISTGNAFNTTSESENCTPRRAPQSSPATRLVKPASAHTKTHTRGRRMPTAKAANGSSATARSESPSRDHLASSESPSTSTPAVAAANRSNWLTITPARCSGLSSMPRSSPCTCAPQKSCAAPSSTRLKPSVAMNSTIGGRFTSGRSTKRPVRTAIATNAASDAANASHMLQPCSRRLT